MGIEARETLAPFTIQRDQIERERPEFPLWDQPQPETTGFPFPGRKVGIIPD
jgi:hypothetical protein